MRFWSGKSSGADKHPLHNPLGIAWMLIAIPGVVFVSILVWAAP